MVQASANGNPDNNRGRQHKGQVAVFADLTPYICVWLLVIGRDVRHKVSLAAAIGKSDSGRFRREHGWTEDLVYRGLIYSSTSMAQTAALEFNDVSKEYRGFFQSEHVTALNHFSLRVEQGEIFGFLGPNGAGKTTAIHIAMGLMFPSRGTGRMLGAPFGDVPTRRRVGFLSENVALFHRRAARVIEFYGALNGIHGAHLRQQTLEMLKEMDLLAVANRNVGKFSRGMLQRVGLAQALVNNPDLLILDEPTSALDPIGRVRVREIILRAREAGKTIFLSSHLLSEIEQICDRLAIVIKGRVVRLGTVAELLEAQDRFVITAKGIDALMFEGAQQNGYVKITVPTLHQRSTIEKIWLAGGEVIAVHPMRRTLEDLFVELAHQNGGSHSHERDKRDKDDEAKNHE